MWPAVRRVVHFRNRIHVLGNARSGNDERLEHQGPVNLSAATLTPREAASAAGIRLSSLRLEMRDGRPVYRISQRPVYADTGNWVHRRRNHGRSRGLGQLLASGI